VAEDTEGIDRIAQLVDGVKGGYLVDVGAHDGIAPGSMSRALVASGWGGLMVEPLPAAFAKLERAYRGNDGVRCVNVACSDGDGTSQLYPCKGVSTLHKDWADVCDGWWKHVNYGAPITVKTRRLGRLLDEAGAPAAINLLQIDTEGHDLTVLQGMDWTRRVDVVCVETLDMVHRERRIGGRWHPSPDLNSFMVAHGFALDLLTPGGNGIYVRRVG